MSKDKKYSYEQIIFTDNLIKIYGFMGLIDYESKLNISDITDDMINKTNKSMNEFKKIFPVKGFNLDRTKFVITGKSMALSFIKNCLKHIGMRYEDIRIKNKTYLRLRKPNINLNNYIDNKMSNIGKLMSDVGNPKSMFSVQSGKKVYEDAFEKWDIWEQNINVTLSKSHDLQPILAGRIEKIELATADPTKKYILMTPDNIPLLESELIDNIPTFNTVCDPKSYPVMFRYAIKDGDLRYNFIGYRENSILYKTWPIVVKENDFYKPAFSIKENYKEQIIHITYNSMKKYDDDRKDEVIFLRPNKTYLFPKLDQAVKTIKFSHKVKLIKTQSGDIPVNGKEIDFTKIDKIEEDAVFAGYFSPFFRKMEDKFPEYHKELNIKFDAYTYGDVYIVLDDDIDDTECIYANVKTIQMTYQDKTLKYIKPSEAENYTLNNSFCHGRVA